MRVGLAHSSLKWRIYGALLLTAAICSHHFTAMGAVSIIPDPTIEVSKSALPTSWLAIAVALASFTILILAFAGVALDVRDRRRSELEADRMRGLANAAVEGLLVCDGEVIVTVNNSFLALSGLDQTAVIGARLQEFFPDGTSRAKLLKQPNQAVETSLQHRNGSTIPVETILRLIDFAGKPHFAVAVRDLRARKQAE
jgi:PAS domain S-box-containing protein